jgi:hypothetical protein
MAMTIGAILKATIIVSVSIGCAYYYGYRLPQRYIQLDKEKRKEAERVRAEHRQEQEKTAARQRAIEQQRETEQKLALSRYQQCLSTAQENYDLNWSNTCAKVFARGRKGYSLCVAEFPRSVCEEIFAQMEPLPKCSLPTPFTENLNLTHEKEKSRCLEEYRAGSQ